MSRVHYKPTQYRKTLVASHVAAIRDKICRSEFGGRIDRCADVNWGYIDHGVGSPRRSEKCGIALTLWKDQSHAEGNCVHVIFEDCVGDKSFSAYYNIYDILADEFPNSFI